MATAHSSMYHTCLQEFQKDITSGITQTDVNVERLTEKARKKGLLLSGHSGTRTADSIAPRDKRVATLVSSCIESVKRDEKLFPNFLEILDYVGLEHLVRRIRIRLSRQGGNQKSAGLRLGKVPPLSDDSGIVTVSASVNSNSQSLPPLPGIPSALLPHQSPFHNEGVKESWIEGGQKVQPHNVQEVFLIMELRKNHCWSH